MQDRGYDELLDGGIMSVGRARGARGYNLLGPATAADMMRATRTDTRGSVGEDDSTAHLVDYSKIMPPAYRYFKHAGKAELPQLKSSDFKGASAYPDGTEFSAGYDSGKFVGGAESEYMSSSGSMAVESLCSAAREGARVPTAAVRLGKTTYADSALARRTGVRDYGGQYGAQSYAPYGLQYGAPYYGAPYRGEQPYAAYGAQPYAAYGAQYYCPGSSAYQCYGQAQAMTRGSSWGGVERPPTRPMMDRIDEYVYGDRIRMSQRPEQIADGGRLLSSSSRHRRYK